MQQILNHQPHSLLILANLRLNLLNGILILPNFLQNILTFPHISHPLFEFDHACIEHHLPILLLETALMIVDLQLPVIQLQILLAVVDQVYLHNGVIAVEVAELLLHELLDFVEGDVLGEAFEQDGVVCRLVLELDPSQMR
jgi:hypothetical protein